MLKKRHNTVKVFIAMLAVLLCIIAILLSIKSRAIIGDTYLFVIVAACAVLMTWVAFSITVGREANIVVQPCNYPPEGINPLLAGYIENGEINDRDIISSFYYLAERGYFDIIEYDVHKFAFLIKKPSDNEDLIMQTLFKSIVGDASVGDTVKLIDAKTRLIDILPKIESMSRRSIVKHNNREIADITGKVLGLKDSIIKTKGDELKRITDKDDNYLYVILPYAYAFAITSKLSSNFGPIKVNMPKWYKAYKLDEDYEFDVVFYNAMLKYLPEQIKLVVLNEYNELRKMGIK